VKGVMGVKGVKGVTDGRRLSVGEVQPQPRLLQLGDVPGAVHLDIAHTPCAEVAESTSISSENTWWTRTSSGPPLAPTVFAIASRPSIRSHTEPSGLCGVKVPSGVNGRSLSVRFQLVSACFRGRASGTEGHKPGAGSVGTVDRGVERRELHAPPQ
jgi:hypothetical protein